MFGNPFDPPTFNPMHLSPTVVILAKTIYDRRSFDSMPELAAALEAAGCNDKAILEHCREPGLHVRGCWALDLLLGNQ
jgi:hypothetical protein